MPVTTGLEHLLGSPRRWLGRGRVGLLCNQASVDSRLRHARDLLARTLGRSLTALFSPQHGIEGEKQDNMVESPHGRDSRLGIPVYSLYGDVRRPAQEMLSGLDVLVVDLQDAGCRVYTFITTLRYCLEEAARLGKKVVVLDRPNPCGGGVEGPVLRDELHSFVGAHPIALRHGLTMGELARLFNDQGRIGADLDVVPMGGWRRRMHFAETGLPWVPPSPNLPIPDSALVYPGQVLLEGTNLSEGRGTTRPFEIFGAPWIDPPALAAALRRYRLPGVVFRGCRFEPTHQKWAGEDCGGLQLHLTDRRAFLPYRTTVTILREVIRLWSKEFSWRQPPYEYERTRLPFDLISGDTALRRALEAGRAPADIVSADRHRLDRYREGAENFLLYR